MRASDPRRALVLDYSPPRRSSGGSSARAFDLVALLAGDGWSVSVATAEMLADPRDAHDLRQSGVPVHDGTTAEFETLVAAGDYSVAICASWPIAELYSATLRRLSPQTALVVDCPCLQLARDSYLAVDDGGADPVPPLGAEWGSEATGELNAYAAADAVLAASPGDADLVNSLLGDEGLASWVPDAAEGRGSRVRFTSRRGIVLPEFGEDPSYADAAEYFSDEIQPRLGREVLDRHPVLDGGADGLPLDRAWLTVLPLRRPPETARALTRSLAAGTPVAATSAAVRGLGSNAGVLVADDAASLAAAIERLSGDEQLWRRLSRGGRSRVRRVRGREAVKRRLVEAVERAQARAARRRPPLEGTRERFELRLRRQRNRELMPAIRKVVREAVPSGARIVVISEGADELLRLARAEVVHFPRDAAESGPAAGPADSGEAIALLEHEIRAGADVLLIPSTASAWVDSYPAFRDYLRDRFTQREHEACTVVELRREEAGSFPEIVSPVRLIAFYLPQFHPVPENDRWWGPGFTEWTNVVRAEPLFPGHDQPKVPGELDFYDLRSVETREAQARLAAEAGIEAFCYYHYWFHGKRLLETPFAEVLESGRPDFPFCLCWANEPWSRRWDGSENDVLQPQRYSSEDDLDHIRWLIPALVDPRAVTVAGRPLFLVYRARSLPDPARTADLWRQEVRRAGLPGLHLVSVETRRDAGWNPTLAGFDASVRFQPEFSTLQNVPMQDVDGPSSLRVWSYEEAWKQISRGVPPAYRRYESVFPAWDNTPRRGERGWVLHNSTPESYGRWLRQEAEDALAQPSEHRLVFINAWNEWAEGAYLEPDRRHGRAYLAATRAVVDSISGRRPAERRDAGLSAAAPASLDEPVGVG